MEFFYIFFILETDICIKALSNDLGTEMTLKQQ